MAFDILIVNGRIIDGSGNPWYWGDVGIEGGIITATGKLGSAEAGEVIDATGLVICPGFIDMHCHSDVMLLGEPRHEPKVRQGVTTELLGGDGLSYAPISPDNLKMLRWYLAGLNGNPDIAWDWTSVADFLSRFDGNVAVNVAYLVPHCALRIEVMGMENRLPSERELERMKGLAAQAMTEGAVGFSTGLTYAPCCYSDTHELIEICKVVAQHGGIFDPHLRDYCDGIVDAIREVIVVGESANVPVQLCHYQAAGALRGKSEEMLAMVDEARDGGVDVTFDSYPYIAGSSVLHATLPTWMHEGGPQVMMDRLSDPSCRRRIRDEIGQGWDGIFLCSLRSGGRKSWEGRPMAELIERSGKEPVDFVCDLLLEENLEVSYMAFGLDEEDVRRVMSHPVHMASSDGLLIGGKPNPRGFGTFPRYLGRYVRELRVLRLEDAIRRMTSLPAQRICLKDRGLLREGFAADVVAFDPETVKDRATFEEGRRFPEGIEYVIVNGKIVIERGEHTGALPGRALKPFGE